MSKPFERAGILAERIRHLARTLARMVEGDAEKETLVYTMQDTAAEIERIVDTEILDGARHG